MALYLDRIEGAGFLRTRNGIQHRRIAVVTGTSTVNPAMVPYLATQVGGMPQPGDPHPNSPNARLEDIDALGVSESDDAIRILLTYRTQTGQIDLPAGQSWYAELDTGLTGRTTQLVPGPDKSPIVINFKDDTGKLYEHQGQVSFLSPIKTLRIIGGTATGANIDAASSLVGTVNNDTFLGDPIGYWLLAGVRVTTRDGGRSHSAEVTAISRCVEDWSEYVWGYDHNTGKNVKVDAIEVTVLKRQAYSYGISYPNNNNTKGIARIGPFQAASWNPVFGGLKRP